MQLRDALVLHAAAEETIFYRALCTSTSADGHRGVSRAHEEHHVIKDWLGQVGATSPDAPTFEVFVGRLKAEMESHVLEEEKLLFPLARKVLGAARLRTLGERMAAARSGRKTVVRT